MSAFVLVAEQERELIVAWLRSMQMAWDCAEPLDNANLIIAHTYGEAAIAIERGEHLTDTPAQS